MLTFKDGNYREGYALFGFLQGKSEGRAQAFRAAHIDRLIVSLNNMLDNSQPQSGTADLP